MSGVRISPGNRERLARGAALLLVLLLATVLRVWRLESMPPGLYHDEAYNGLDALSLIQGKTFPQFYEGWELYAADAHGERPAQEGRWPIFFEGNYGREPLHIYLMATTIQVFGASVFAIRLVPALAGVLGVLTTYLAARELTRKKVRGLEEYDQQSLLRRIVLDPALIAALALAILFPAVHFSRFGIRAMLFVPLATLTVTLFWRGINTGEAARDGGSGKMPVVVYFVLAGAFLGLGLYSYAAARLFPLVFVAFVPYWFWRDRDAFRQHRAHVAVMAGVAFVTALPLILFFARYPYYFVFRIAYVANKGKGVVEDRPWLTWLTNVGRVTRGLFLNGETHLRHNLPGRPFLDLTQAGLFLAGAVVTIRQRVRFQSAFLWLWLVVMLLPSIFSGDAPHFGRLIGAAPVLAIFIGIGWAGLMRFLMGRVPENRTSLIIGLGVAMLAASAIWTTVDYFGRYGGHPDLPEAFYQSDWELGSYLAELPAETSLYLTPAQEELATIYYALEAPERLTNFTGSAGLVPAGIVGQPSLYVVRPWDAGYLGELKRLLPNGQELDGQEQYLLYAAASAYDQLVMQNETDVSWAGEIGLVGWSQGWQGEQLMVTLIWRADGHPDKAYTAFVHTLDEDGEIVAQVDRPPKGYPTSNWRRGEFVMDTFVLDLPSGVEEVLTLQTGFYYLPTLANLGEPAVLGDVETSERDS